MEELDRVLSNQSHSCFNFNTLLQYSRLLITGYGNSGMSYDGIGIDQYVFISTELTA